AAVYEKYGEDTLPYEALGELPLTESFCKEILRLYSPVQLLPRRSVQAFEFAGQSIPANAPILMPTQGTHVNERYFTDPEKLDPWRFVQEDKVSPFAFIPFGRGKHMCLGMHFAMMEVKAVLYQVLRRRTMSFDTSQNIDISYMPVVRPRQPLMVAFDS
ncbi:MAG: cytochrome P450, partial [Pseudomonadota bacterium]